MASGKTKTLTVTDAAAVAITAETYTATIIIGEDVSVANWPTTDFLILKPADTDTGIRKLAGTSYIFQKSTTANHNGFYNPGEVAGYVKLVVGGGSTTFFQDELGA